MEGFVTIRTTFGGYLKVWMVLDAQQLSYYDDFDLPNQKPKKLKGTMNVKDAEVKKNSDDNANIKHGLKIKATHTKGGNVSKLQCALPDAAICSAWYNALNRAVKLHTEEEDRANKPMEYKKTLQLDEKPGEKLTQSAIAKAYKKICLTAHPDKGGDPAVFNQVRHAYTELMALQQSIDEKESTVAVQFEALIEKVPGLGLGISVVEDKLKRQIVVSSVNEKTKIHGITEDSHGAIRAGDILVGIENDDCSLWWLSRIRARLDNYRIAMNEKVLLTFERRIHKDDLDNYMKESQQKATENSDCDDDGDKSGESDEEKSESEEDENVPHSQQEAEDLIEKKRREAEAFADQNKKPTLDDTHDENNKSSPAKSVEEKEEEKPLPTIILSPPPPPAESGDDESVPPAPPLNLSPYSQVSSEGPFDPPKRRAAVTLQLDEDEEDEDEVEVEYVMKEDYDAQTQELQRTKSDLEEIRIQAFGMTEKISELESANSELKSYCDELQGANHELIKQNEILRRDNDELTYQNASYKNVIDSQFHTMSSQNMKNYLLVLQQKVLDFDMQQRELLHRLETNNRNVLSQDPLLQNHIERKQHYQKNEERAKQLEAKMKTLCQSVNHHQ